MDTHFFVHTSWSNIFFSYLCQSKRVATFANLEGVPYYQAEIIPIVPDTGNAETGMRNQHCNISLPPFRLT